MVVYNTLFLKCLLLYIGRNVKKCFWDMDKRCNFVPLSKKALIKLKNELSGVVESVFGRAKG